MNLSEAHPREGPLEASKVVGDNARSEAASAQPSTHPRTVHYTVAVLGELLRPEARAPAAFPCTLSDLPPSTLRVTAAGWLSRVALELDEISPWARPQREEESEDTAAGGGAPDDQRAPGVSDVVGYIARGSRCRQIEGHAIRDAAFASALVGHIEALLAFGQPVALVAKRFVRARNAHTSQSG